MLQTFTLKNGLKVATYSIPQMRSVYVDIAVKGGALLDNPKRSGAAHFMEHILVQGTPSFPDSQSFSDYIESLAGSFNASTSYEVIKFYISLPASHLDEALRISKEVFFEPLFTPESIEKEREAILTEMRQSHDSLGYKISTFFKENRYPKTHPIQMDILGTKESVENMTREDLVSYWQRFFHPQNTYLVVVGKIDPETIEATLEKHFGNLEKGKNFTGFEDMKGKDFNKKGVFIREDEKLNAVYVDISIPSISAEFDNKTLVIQQLARSILGGLGSSRLYRLLRHQKGLVYHAGFTSVMFQKFGFVDGFTQVSLENLDEVLDLMFMEIEGFVKDGPTKEELEFAKNYFENRTLMQFDHPSNIAGWISSDLLWDEKIYTPEEYAQLIASISLKDINDFMKKYWEFSKIQLTLQGPIKETAANTKKFSKYL